MLAVNALLTSY
jgi:hypothetical protein